ncbi:hypothetical protein Gotri_000151, partial [Gossypium trilobum]|nr:hypothetical protein [Gossypium trilobum]
MVVMGKDRWVPPSRESVKVNFDVVFQKDKQKYASGILIRNREGLIMVVCIHPNSHIVDPFMAEARACEQMVSFMVDLGFKK